MTKAWPSFDELKTLAEQSPEALEDFRSRQIEALIAQAPAQTQRRLRGLQFQINCQLQKHKTPMASCIAISKMMHESLLRLNSALNGGADAKQTLDTQRDNILPFPGQCT